MAANIYSAFIIIKLLLYFEVSLLHVASISMQFFFHRNYYGCEIAGFSIPAAEHRYIQGHD